MHWKNCLRVGACAAALFLAGSGCGASGPKLYKMTGKVTMDGKPVSGATVHYEPYNDDPANRTGNQPAEGRTGEDGIYNLTTNTTNDGVAAGEYKVIVSKVTGGSGAGAIDAPPPGTDPVKYYEQMKAAGKMDQKGLMKSAPKAQEQELPIEYGSPEKTPWKVKVPTSDGKFDLPLKKGGGT